MKKRVSIKTPICPICGKPIENSKICKNCGASLDGVIICPNCGNEEFAKNNFCRKCKYPLKKNLKFYTSYPKKVNIPAEHKNKIKKTINLSLIALLILITIPKIKTPFVQFALFVILGTLIFTLIKTGKANQ